MGKITITIFKINDEWVGPPFIVSTQASLIKKPSCVFGNTEID